MKRLYLALIFFGMLISFSVGAEQFIIKPKTQGEVTFVTGGVGEDERNAMQAMRAVELEPAIFGKGYRIKTLLVFYSIRCFSIQIADRDWFG